MRCLTRCASRLNGRVPILPSVRDPRLITVRRGGTLTDDDHRAHAEWAAQCAEHVLPLFEREVPDDPRPREALAVARAWIRGEVPMKVAHRTAFTANAAARDRRDPAKFAALAAGQAVAVAHVAAHNLGAAAYAIRAAESAARMAILAGAVEPAGARSDAAGTSDLTAAAAGTSDLAASAAEAARLAERDWQRARLPASIRAFVLEDQLARDDLCWGAFSD